MATSVPDASAIAGEWAALVAAERSPMSETYQLTRAIGAGDEAAFEQFYSAYAGRIHGQLLALARGDERTAQELCQRVMIKLAGGIPVLEQEADLRAWLGRVTRNTFIDHCRTAAVRRKVIPLSEISETKIDADNQLRQALDAAMTELPATDAELLNKIYIDRQPIADAAEELGVSYKALESRLTRLRRKVKEHMIRQMRNGHNGHHGHQS
jgi:RNA polymerase sigma factor (sigma-70 family)